MPFLHPAFIRRVLRVVAQDAGTDVALPVARGYPQPLAAAYRVSLAATAERLVEEDRLRPAFLFSECATVRLDDAALKADPLIGALDPDLDSVVNINTPGDYQEARARPAPEVTVQLFGALATGDSPRARCPSAPPPWAPPQARCASPLVEMAQSAGTSPPR
jgi:molybdopterin-guanine dinucleotide biosynthesis protein A